ADDSADKSYKPPLVAESVNNNQRESEDEETRRLIEEADARKVAEEQELLRLEEEATRRAMMSGEPLAAKDKAADRTAAEKEAEDRLFGGLFGGGGAPKQEQKLDPVAEKIVTESAAGQPDEEKKGIFNVSDNQMSDLFDNLLADDSSDKKPASAAG